jgi:hypothetical protein
MSPGARRVLIYVVALVAAFLLGLVPMWLTARERGRELDEARRALTLSRMQNQLSAAALGARRGDYEPARQSASEFFSSVSAEVDKGDNSALTSPQREAVAGLLVQRDDLITLLARSDPASADRLAEMYVAYQRALGQPSR